MNESQTETDRKRERASTPTGKRKLKAKKGEIAKRMPESAAWISKRERKRDQRRQ